MNSNLKISNIKSTILELNTGFQYSSFNLGLCLIAKISMKFASFLGNMSSNFYIIVLASLLDYLSIYSNCYAIFDVLICRSLQYC